MTPNAGSSAELLPRAETSPVSALAGAILLLLADTMTRAVLPVEVPIGVLTALIGGPFFCIIFRQKQKGKSYE